MDIGDATQAAIDVHGYNLKVDTSATGDQVVRASKAQAGDQARGIKREMTEQELKDYMKNVLAGKPEQPALPVASSKKPRTIGEKAKEFTETNFTGPEPKYTREKMNAAGQIVRGKTPSTRTNYAQPGMNVGTQKIAEQFGHFREQRGTGQTWKETIAKAKKLGMTVEQLADRPYRKPMAAHEAAAAEMLMEGHWLHLKNLADKAVSGNDEAAARLIAAYRRHALMFAKMSSSESEGARAQNFLKARPRLHATRDAMFKDMIERTGGIVRVRDLADQISKLDNLDQANEFVKKSFQPKWYDRLMELRISFLLTGLESILFKNPLSSIATNLGEVPVTAMAATLGKLHGGADRVYYREIAPQTAGLFAGALQGIKSAAKTMQTEQSQWGGEAAEQGGRKAIAGLKGRIVRFMPSVMLATDVFNKEVAYASKKAQLATRAALEAGLRGEDAKAKFRELVQEPTPGLQDAAVEHGHYITFTNEFGKFGQDLMRLLSRHPAVNVPVRLAIPFIQMPINAVKMGVLHYSPLAPLSAKYKAAKESGSRADLDTARARMAIGTMAYIVFYNLAAAGVLTGGGPTDPNKRKAWLIDHEPYSWKIGDKWYSYNWFEPIAIAMGLSADFAAKVHAATPDEAQSIVGALIYAFSNTMSNKSYLQGASNALAAWQDEVSGTGKKTEAYLSNIIASFIIPVGVSQISRKMDPVLRDTSALTFADRLIHDLERRTPGLSKNLPPRIDPRGKPITYEKSWPEALNYVSPIHTKKAGEDKVAGELQRLNIAPGTPQKAINDHRLTPWQYALYAQLAGKYTWEELGNEMARRDWKDQSDDDKRHAVKFIRDRAFRRARGEMMDLDQKLAEKLPPGHLKQ